MLNIGQIPALEKIRTPFYYYDMDLLKATLDALAASASSHGIEVHYAVKANVDERILRMISSCGFGADCVSGNEVLRAAECGFRPDNIVFAGVGKTEEEICNALKVGIFAFNCESLDELAVLNDLAGKMGMKANVSLRINPNIDSHTHKYITTGLYDNKFGIAAHEFDAAAAMFRECPNIVFNGLHFHIGSQIMDVEDVFSLECRRANEIAEYFESAGLSVANIDLGGGLGVDYADPDGSPIAAFDRWFGTIDANIDRKGGRRIHVEPGRSVVAQCGTLFTKVLYVKHGERKTFLITDAGMNDLIRPALYGAYHKVENVSAKFRGDASEKVYDVVGPVCESADVWGEDRVLPATGRGDLLAIRTAGAYGQVMSNRYNLRDYAGTVYSDSAGSGK